MPAFRPVRSWHPGHCRYNARTLTATQLTGSRKGNTPARPSGKRLQNIYDELGWLKAVVDSSGNAAIYSYDAAGNIAAIARPAAGLAVIQVTPNSGAVGATVTVYGTGFSSAPANDSVSFNGTAATVTAATNTSLTTSTPSGASSGTISVTVSGSTAVSGGVIAGPGTAITVSGGNFDATPANNKVRINDTYATVTSVTNCSGNLCSSMAISVPAVAASGHISVTTPGGSATSSGDVFLPAPGLGYSNIVTGPVVRTTLGTATPLTFSSSSTTTFGQVLVDASAGQRLVVTASNFSSSFGQRTQQRRFPARTARVWDVWDPPRARNPADY